MGRITVFSNPLEPTEKVEYGHVGPFIGFLMEHYPTGFHGPHCAALNLKAFRVEDYDTEIGPDDEVGLTINLAEPGMLVGLGMLFINYVAPALAAQALNYAVNKIFGPKGAKPEKPKSEQGDAGTSPTYTLGIPTNVARIGQIIPVAYGRNLLVPDLAAYPYKFYKSNEEYVALFLCLGMGYFYVHNTFIGDTALGSLGPGIVAYYGVWSPGDHARNFGVIQNQLGWDSGWRENMYTSPEVSDQELIAGRTNTVVATDRALACDCYINITGYQPPDVDDPDDPYDTPYTPPLIYITTFTLSANPPASMQQNPLPSPLWMRFTRYLGGPSEVHQVSTLTAWGSGTFVGAGPLYGGNVQALLSFDSTFSDISDVYTGPGTKIGPFNCGGTEVLTELIYVDLLVPALYEIREGEDNPLAYYVGVTICVEAIDQYGNFIATQVYYRWAVNEVIRRPYRPTSWAVSVPRGRYRVWLRRETSALDPNKGESAIYWVGLRCEPSITNLWNHNAYEHCTLMALVLKASQGLSSDALSRVSVDCTRKVEMHDGSFWPTSNPTAAFIDAYINPHYGGRRPLSELDLVTIDGFGVQWEGKKFFNAVFDQPSTLWETLGLTLQMAHAAPVVVGSRVSIVEDKDYKVGTFHLHPGNITSFMLTFLFSDGEEPDGVEGEYRDPNDNAALYATWPATAVDPERITLWGCRDYNTAIAYVKQRWLQLVHRRRLIKLETELEGHVLSVGDPVNVSHPLLDAIFQDGTVLCVVQSVIPKEDLAVEVNLHLHVSEVYY